MTAKQEFDELLAFLSSSAMGCIGEPQLYGPLRLADAMGRLIALAKHAGISDSDALDAVAERIERDKNLCMTDEEGFCLMIRDVALAVVDYVKE